MNRFMFTFWTGPSVIPMIIKFYCVAVISFYISGNFSYDLSLLVSEYSSSFNSSENELELEPEWSEPSPPSVFFFTALIFIISYKLNGDLVVGSGYGAGCFLLIDRALIILPNLT